MFAIRVQTCLGKIILPNWSVNIAHDTPASCIQPDTTFTSKFTVTINRNIAIAPTLAWMVVYSVTNNGNSSNTVSPIITLYGDTVQLVTKNANLILLSPNQTLTMTYADTLSLSQHYQQFSITVDMPQLTQSCLCNLLQVGAYLDTRTMCIDQYLLYNSYGPTISVKSPADFNINGIYTYTISATSPPYNGIVLPTINYDLYTYGPHTLQQCPTSQDTDVCKYTKYSDTATATVCKCACSVKTQGYWWDKPQSVNFYGDIVFHFGGDSWHTVTPYTMPPIKFRQTIIKPRKNQQYYQLLSQYFAALLNYAWVTHSGKCPLDPSVNVCFTNAYNRITTDLKTVHCIATGLGTVSLIDALQILVNSNPSYNASIKDRLDAYNNGYYVGTYHDDVSDPGTSKY
jgi:hypothetical protein